MDDKDENQESITADVAGLAGSLGDEQPKVSEHAVAIEQQKSDERKAAFADLKDSDARLSILLFTSQTPMANRLPQKRASCESVQGARLTV
jgi:protein involved in temperature-dependent protein secretion